MKPEELRIGNWILDEDNCEVRIAKVIVVDDYHHLGIRHNGTPTVSKVSPIPITEIWLDKLGFKKEPMDDNECYWSYRLNDDTFCDLSFITGDKNGELEVCLFPYERWFRYKYVHQIQNLFFTITGKELTIKNK